MSNPEESEIYSLLRDGEITTAEATYTKMLDDNYYEVADTIYPTAHLQEFLCIYVSDDWFGSLDEETQKIVKDAADAFLKETAEWMLAREEESLATLEKNGMTVDEEVDIDGLYETVRQVWDTKFESGEWAYTYDEIDSYRTGVPAGEAGAADDAAEGEEAGGEAEETGADEDAPDAEESVDDGAGVSMGGIYNDETAQP